MPLIVIGCNHHSAELALLERVAVPVDEQPKALRSLVGLEHVTEAAIISTCNRVEIYAQVARFHPGSQELRGWLAERGDIHPQDLDEVQYSYHDEHAAAHLFAVTGGLDSMVVGERQIALQVKQAMELARAEGTARRTLLRLFRQAVRVGRRIRQETAISTGSSSMVDEGLRAAADRLGAPLAGRTVCIVGAGKLGALTADRLAGLGVTGVEVWNRSADKAARLAARVGGEVVAPEGLVDALATADVVVCTTGAAEPLLDEDRVARALARRAPDHGELVLLDLGVPRNVDPACRGLPGVAVIDVEQIRDVVRAGVAGEVIEEARAIVADEADRFLTWTRTSSVDPTIRSVREYAEAVRLAEIDRLAGRLTGLAPAHRETVEALTRGIINTLLHGPTLRLKELADAGAADPHADALRELFDLPEAEAPGAVDDDLPEGGRG